MEHYKELLAPKGLLALSSLLILNK